MSSKLLLVTNEFPYGLQETFLENEIEVLSDSFERIIIVSVNGMGHARSVPSNVEYLSALTLERGRQENILELIAMYVNGLLKEGPKWRYLYHFFAYQKYLKNELVLKRKLKKLVEEKLLIGCYAYSYWFMFGCLAIGWLKKEKYFTKAISRAHGNDLYDERQGGHLPFRNLKVSMLDNVVTISNHGKFYFKQRVNDRAKIGMSYLGTRDYGMAPFHEHEVFRIISCSNVIPLKRVELIAKSILKLKFPVEWVHFGDGISMPEVLQIMKMKPDHIRFISLGRIRNHELMKFYQKTSVNAFINLSDTEGLPVSMMEAISFGVPIIATNVGGVSELVNDKTGILLDWQSDSIVISDAIELFRDSEMNTSQFRLGVRKFWLNKFVSFQCYSEFIQTYLN